MRGEGWAGEKEREKGGEGRQGERERGGGGEFNASKIINITTLNFRAKKSYCTVHL